MFFLLQIYKNEKWKKQGITFLMRVIVYFVCSHWNGIRKLYENVNMDSSCLHELYLVVGNFKNDLREKSRTARLWLQYMDYVEICRLFIRAVRTAN